MKQGIFEIVENIPLTENVFKMTLRGDVSAVTAPGQFVNIKLEGKFLRRPISVCDYSSKHVDILYKILGRGTKDLSCFEDGIYLDCLVGLGNGFTVKENIKPLLVAGGIGIAPLVGLAKAFNKIGIKPTLVYGARSYQDIVLKDELEKLTDLYICTDDGTLGFKGNVIECIKHHNFEFDYYYSCGPQVMLKYLAQAYPNGCVSLEARMGCGFGACMGCSIETTNGPKRVCKEGPVFEASEVLF